MTVRYEERPLEEAQQVGRLVELIQHATQSRVLALVCMDPSGEVYVSPQPGREVEVLRRLRAMDWESGVRLAEEHSDC